MPVAINMPQRTGSPLEGIASALNILGSVYGIKANSEALERAKREEAMNKEKFDMAKQEFQRKQSGELTAAEFLKDAEKYAPAKEGEAGAIKIPVRQGSGLTEYVVKPRHGGEGLEDFIKKLQVQKLAGEISDQSRNRNSEKAKFDALPIENQEQMKDLSRASASKRDIKNHIDASLKLLDSHEIPDDQKIVAGQNLLKTLNSTEGKDAVGAEESKRLGSFLEYKIFNITNPGSFMGRDLGKFTEQVRLKSSELGDAVSRNTDQVKRMYNGDTSVAQTPMRPPAPAAGDDLVQKASAAKAADVRVIDGVTYQRAQGGWKRL